MKREEERSQRRKAKNNGGFIGRGTPRFPVSYRLCHRDTVLLSPHLLMARAPPPSRVTERRCICGCKTTNTRTMNKHMKTHSQRLNIKTTQLASLTAVFHSKKRRTPTADNSHLSAMDVDEEGHLPELDTQIGGLEAISEGPALQSDGSEIDDGDSSDGGCTDEGLLVDSDSEDEFESDGENAGGHGDGVGKGRGPLEFELRAAEAGSFLC